MTEQTRAAAQTILSPRDWIKDKVYYQGDKVSWLGQTYQAAYWTQGNEPDKNSYKAGDPWKPMAELEASQACEAEVAKEELATDTDKKPKVMEDPHPIEAWFTEAMWNELFPKQNHECFEKATPYSYGEFVKAVRHFPEFASSDSMVEQKKEVAALLGMCLQEVGGKSLADGGPMKFIGLSKTKESGFAEPNWDTTPSYNWNFAFSSEQNAERSTHYDTGYELKPNQKYFSGAGILQLSYPVNYARFSQYYFGNKNVLLNNSDRVRKEGELAIGSGIFYWMFQADARPSPHCCFTGKPVNEIDSSCFDRITKAGYKQGLAMAICAVNGIECGEPADYRVGTRVYGYLSYGKYFGLTEQELLENCSLETADMPKNLNAV